MGEGGGGGVKPCINNALTIHSHKGDQNLQICDYIGAVHKLRRYFSEWVGLSVDMTSYIILNKWILREPVFRRGGWVPKILSSRFVNGLFAPKQSRLVPTHFKTSKYVYDAQLRSPHASLHALPHAKSGGSIEKVTHFQISICVGMEWARSK